MKTAAYSPSWLPALICSWLRKKNGLTSSQTGLTHLPIPAFIARSLLQPSLHSLLPTRASGGFSTATAFPPLPILPCFHHPSLRSVIHGLHLPLAASLHLPSFTHPPCSDSCHCEPLLSLCLGLLCENGVIVALLQRLHECASMCVCVYMCM